MVLNSTVCARISSKWREGGLFSSRWQNTVARWAISHLEKYKEPLGAENVETVFQTWAVKNEKAETTIDLMEKFLYQFDEHLIEKVESMSPEFILDMAGEVFNGVRVRETIRLAELDMEENNVERASSRLASSLRVELGVGSLFRPGEDYGRWRDAFDADRSRGLIRYPGELGNFIGDDLCRDAFVSFLGGYGVGKSFWLLDAAYRGVRNRYRVAFFVVGDMSEAQIIKRMGQRVLRRPKRDEEIRWPVGWKKDGSPHVKIEKRLAITPQESYKEWKKIQRKADLLRLSCHPSVSINAEGIDSLLLGWQREGWVADIVILDYADNLAPPSGIQEKREQINTTWQYLRRLSQEYHCLLLTATQADADSYEKRVLGKRNFSDDRRKHDHLTTEIGINQMDDEKEIGVYRLNLIKRREEYYNVQRQIKIAGCLAVGCPVVKSGF
jgi:hypothetical protein